MWAQTCASSWCTRGGITDTETADGPGTARPGHYRPRAEPGDHALAEQECEAEAGARHRVRCDRVRPAGAFHSWTPARASASAATTVGTSAPFFFLAPECALERATVDGEPKAATNVVEQRRHAERGVVAA